MALDQARIEIGGDEISILHEPVEKSEIGDRARDLEFPERLAHSLERRGAIIIPDDELGDHGVVVDRDLVAGPHTRFHAHVPGFRGQGEMSDASGSWQKIPVRVLGVDARLDRVAADAQVFLGDRESFARGDPKLPFDQIEAGDHFGDRVLDLKPRVHLHEMERPRAIDDELDGSRADIADGFRGRHRGLAHLAAARFGHAGRGRLFEHFLVAPLHRAVALKERETAALPVGEHLDLDMPGALEVFFQEHALVTESRQGFAPACGERRVEFRLVLDRAHAFAAAAGRSLD